ncbi:putative disease resistance RPP13-like protein 1 [Tanacetum coccineum]
MRYLNFSKTSITYLPEQVYDLYYLQVLLLHGCEKLVCLPKSFAKLVTLRHLDVSDTSMLKKLPSKIGGMTSLQFLSKVNAARQAEESELQIKHLEDLVLEWSDVFDDYQNKENENEVFEKTKPHRILKVVTIAPELFPSLEVLELEDMQGWENWSDNNDGSTILFPCPSLRFL